MTFRTQILAGLIAGLAVPAFTYASSAGLTQYDIEHGQTSLLSSRASAPERPKESKGQGASQLAADPSQEQARHQRAMETGAVRMTTGSMEGTTKK